LLDHYIQFFEAFSRAGPEYTFTGIDEKACIVDRALNQGFVQVEKLVFDPIERRASMWAGISIGKVGIVVFNNKTLDSPSIVFDAESTRTRVR